MTASRTRALSISPIMSTSLRSVIGSSAANINDSMIGLISSIFSMYQNTDGLYKLLNFPGRKLHCTFDFINSVLYGLDHSLCRNSSARNRHNLFNVFYLRCNMLLLGFPFELLLKPRLSLVFCFLDRKSTRLNS